MADFDTGDADRPAQFGDIGKQIWSAMADTGVLAQGGQAVSGWITWGLAGLIAVFIRLTVPVAATIARGIARGEDQAEVSFGELAAVTVEHVLGINVPSSAWIPRGGAGGRSGAMEQIAALIISGIAGPGGGETMPSIEGAKRFLTIPLKLSLESWLEGWLIEFVTRLPGMDGIKTYAEIGPLLAEALGFGRLTRRVLGPIIDSTITTPATWATHKTYRPTLLGEGEAVRQFVRGRWERDKLDEELARHGYSADRIEGLLVVHRSHLPVADIVEGVYLGMWSEDVAVQYLRDWGFLEDTAHQIVGVDRFRRVNKQMLLIAERAVSAWALGAIDRAQLDSAIANITTDSAERQAWRDRADAMRAFRDTPLSAGELAVAAKRSIISTSEYRDRLRRLGFDEESVSIEELVLRDEIRDADTAKQVKADKAAQLAKEKADRKAEADKRKADLEAKRMHQEPSLAQVERAVVTGLVGIDYYSAYLTAHHYDGPTISFLTGEATQSRAAYVTKQQAAEAARARAARSGLNTAELESAVERGIMSDSEMRSILTTRGLTAEDVDTLVGVADDRHADRELALKKRAEAEAKAAQRNISLAQLERAVRRGVASMGDYQAELAKDGYDAADQAILAALLQSEIDADRAAAQKRQEAADKAAHRGISLAAEERAVLLNVRPIADYRALLVQLGYGGADLSTLVDLLQRQLDDANAARARRQQLEQRLQNKPLSLGQVERAVTLGAMTLGAFRAYLARYGFNADDQDVLVSLEQLQIQAAADAKARRAEIAAKKTAPVISLAQTERAVKAGVTPIGQYTAELAAQGFNQADRETLTSLLSEEAALAQDAAKRHNELLQTGTTKAVSLATEEKAVKNNLVSTAQFGAYLQQEGYDEADQALLLQLVA